MNRAAVAAIPGLLALLALALVSACSYAVVRHGKLDREAAERVERGIARVRDLPFRRHVPMEVKAPDELRGYLEEELRHEYSPEELAGLARVYHALGLLPPGIDLGESLVKLYTSQIAGFYDPRAATLFLVDVATPSGGWWVELLQLLIRRDLVGEMLLAHELTHALQDQNFSVLARADDPDDDDRALAVSAVIEGDATLAGFAYIFGGLARESLLDLVGRLQAIPAQVADSLPETPAVLRESLTFRYTRGVTFTSWAYLRGGWRGVDALLAHPPASTEQVLWPEKYYLEPDGPTAVHLGGLDDYRDDPAWTAVEENTLGELMIRVLATGRFGDERGVEIAGGWDGDRFAAFARDSELRLYWMSVWDSEADAADFEGAVGDILRDVRPTVDRADGRDTQAYAIERRSSRVLAVIGLPAAERAAAMQAVWSGTTFTADEPEIEIDVASAG